MIVFAVLSLGWNFQLGVGFYPGVTYRAAQPKDLKPIVDLLVEAFESHLKWYEFPEKDYRKSRYLKAISKRMIMMEKTGTHNLIVGIAGDGKVAGFVESGMLPPPRKNNPEELATAPCQIKEEVDDVPYLANLCVLKSCKRQGIGRRLVELTSDWANENNHEVIFAAVDEENAEARSLYESMGFVRVDFGEGLSRRVFYSKSLV